MQWCNLNVHFRLVLVTLMVLLPLPTPVQAAPPVRLTFDKTLVSPGVWQGTVGGDISGNLKTVLLSARPAGPNILHVEFDFIVSAGPKSFTTRLSGILNTQTGRVLMNGRVTQGFLLGAQVHEEGQLVNPATLRFVGTIRIMPG